MYIFVFVLIKMQSQNTQYCTIFLFHEIKYMNISSSTIIPLDYYFLNDGKIFPCNVRNISILVLININKLMFSCYEYSAVVSDAPMTLVAPRLLRHGPGWLVMTRPEAQPAGPDGYKACYCDSPRNRPICMTVPSECFKRKKPCYVAICPWFVRKRKWARRSPVLTSCPVVI